MDDDARELALVEKAIRSGLSNCFDWVNDKVLARVRSEPSLQGLTPEYVKRRLHDFIAKEGGRIEQRKEEREHWRDCRRFWYRAVIPEDGFPHGIFVEIVLVDDDQDCPVVALVNAHSQRS
jgi:hypothetical protein